jgi:TonB family protein
MRIETGPAFGARASGICAVVAFLLAAGCARAPAPAESRRAGAAPLAVQVYADTGRGGRLVVRLPAARVWLAQVAPAHASLPTPDLPEVQPESLPPLAEAPPALEVDPGLKPPVLRAPARLVLPRGDARGSVELDVRVDESGTVSAAPWAGGSTDTALVAAARRCALEMRFYPALQAGRPVAVWCRQRFDFAGAGR